MLPVVADKTRTSWRRKLTLFSKSVSNVLKPKPWTTMLANYADVSLVADVQARCAVDINDNWGKL